MLRKVINELFRTDILALTPSWVDRYGGLVQTIKVKKKIHGTDKTTVQSYPISCEVNQEDCNEPSDNIYLDLVPDEAKKSILYFEVIRPAQGSQSFDGATGHILRGFQKYTARVRLVVWINAGKLGVGDSNGNYSCNWEQPYIEQILKTIAKDGTFPNDSDFAGGWYQVGNATITQNDLSIFSKYSYNEYRNYYRYPYAYAAIDFDLSWTYCVGSNTTPILADEIPCVFEQTEQPYSSQFSFGLDGVNESILSDLTTNLNFSNGTTDQQFCILTWLKVETFNVTQRLVSLSNAPSGGISYQLVAQSGRLDFTIFSDANINIRVGLQYAAPAVNEWVCVFIRINTDGTHDMFFNGIQQTPIGSNSTGSYVARSATSKRFYIGGGTSYDGLVNKVAFFTGTKTDAEILALATNQDYTTDPNFYASMTADNSTWDAINARFDITDPSGNIPNIVTVNIEEIDRVTDVP